MEEERLNEIIRQTLTKAQNTPEPPLDEMWAQIERRAFGDVGPRRITYVHQSRWLVTTLAAAAALVVGVGLGWYVAPRDVVLRDMGSPVKAASLRPVDSSRVAQSSAPTTSVASANSLPATTSTTVERVQTTHDTIDPTQARLTSQFNGAGNGSETGRYLTQTAALLASLPSDHAATESDTALATRASDLLTQTHVLLDSRAGSDPTLHRLLEDLELVLAQVARLRGPRNGADLQLIHQALTVHDVLPRVHDATLEASITD